MELKVRIPNGEMDIDVEAFFAGAGIRQIRKLMKIYRDSYPVPAEVRLLLSVLNGYIDSGVKYAKKLAEDYSRANEEYLKQLALYQQMKDPCYAAYTRDKEKLKEQRELVARLKGQATGWKNLFRENERDHKKWCAAVTELREIFDIEDEIGG